MTMHSTTRRGLLLTGLGLLLATAPLGLLATRPALAQDLASAKRSGYLGERIDGFLGVVSSDAPADIRALADAINAKRRNEYAAIASRQGAPIDAVAKLAGERLVERASPGEWVMGADGSWRRK